MVENVAASQQAQQFLATIRNFIHKPQSASSTDSNDEIVQVYDIQSDQITPENTESSTQPRFNNLPEPQSRPIENSLAVKLEDIGLLITFSNDCNRSKVELTDINIFYSHTIKSISLLVGGL